MIDLKKVQLIAGILASLTLIIILAIIVTSNYKYKKKVIQIGNNIFNNLSKVALFRNRLHNLRTRIYNNTLAEDWLIRYKVILYIILSWIGGLISAIVVIIFFRNNLYVTFTLLFFCYQIKEMFLDMLIGNDTKFLQSLYEYGIELQQAFSLNKDVISAIKEANNYTTDYNLVQRMDQVLKLFDDPIELDLYLQDCPNEYLKLLILNCSLVAENGDKSDADGKSVFLENIFYNNQNIETEVFKRKQLEFWLRGLKMLCIIPLLVFSPFETWAHAYMDITDIFYKSTKGFLIKLGITFISIILFFIISGFEKSNRTKSKEQKEDFWEDKLCEFKPIKLFVLKLTPKQNTAKAYRYRKLINESGDYTTTEHIYVRKIIFAIVGFCMVFAIMISIHQINRNNILNNLFVSSELQNSIVAIEKGQKEIVEIENDYFQYVNEEDIEGSYQSIKEDLEEKGIVKGADLIAKDVITKQVKVLNEGISIIDIIISFIGIFLGYNTPETILKVRARYRKQEMENEIIIFETIILIYMYHEHGTSQLILETMAKFADIFKPQVENILKEIKKSDFEALEVLLEEIKFKPFLNITKNLIKAENIKTKDAFISLADNRRNYLMNRKEDNRQIVYKRVNTARALSMITLELIIMLYIAMPLLYISFVQLDKTQSQIIEVESKQ
ncbi:hypothetical protein DVW12_16290 [Clostridium botulinum]|nr:hypothetical protein [Clostridium botulinum]